MNHEWELVLQFYDSSHPDVIDNCLQKIQLPINKYPLIAQQFISDCSFNILSLSYLRSEILYQEQLPVCGTIWYC